MKAKRIWLCALLLCCAGFVYTQDLTIFGEVRPRAEYRDGYAKPIITSNKGGFFVKQRTRIGANFTYDFIEMEVTFQDSRVWGDSSDDTDNPSVGLYQAWALFDILPGFQAKVGRQVLQYDDRKLFGPSDWSDSGNAFDMLLLKYELNDDFKVHAGFSYSNNNDISEETYYQTEMIYRIMGMFWMSKNITKDITLSAIGAILSNQDTISVGGKENYKKRKYYNQGTIGGTFRYTPSSFPLQLMFEGYYQYGRVVYKDALDRLKSYYIVGNASYEFLPWLSVAAGYEYISGDRNPDNGIQRGYMHLFGDTHDFNGTMDYWTNTGERGLQDVYAGVLFELNKKRTSIEGIFHHFKTAVPVKNLKGKKLGYELDFIVKHKQNSWLKFEIGYDIYFTNENVRILKGASGEKTRLAQWVYGSINLNPSVALNVIKKKKD